MEFSAASCCQVFCWCSYIGLFKLFTSVTSHSAGDVDNLDRGVMAHEKHSAGTTIYSHSVVWLNGDRHGNAAAAEDTVLFTVVSGWTGHRVSVWECRLLTVHEVFIHLHHRYEEHIILLIQSFDFEQFLNPQVSKTVSPGAAVNFNGKCRSETLCLFLVFYVDIPCKTGDNLIVQQYLSESNSETVAFLCIYLSVTN